MINIFSTFRAYIASALVVAVIVLSLGILFVPLPARASVPTNCTFIPIPLDINCIKELVLDPALKIAINLALQVILQSTVAWITGAGGQNVGFVENFERVFSQQVDARAGEFLNHLAGINLCSVSLRQYLTVRFSIPFSTSPQRYLNPQLSCSLSGIVSNVENFYNSFQNGGWEAFLKVNLQMENNYYGAYMISLQNQHGLLAEASGALDQNTQANQGYKGVQIPIPSKKCEYIPGTGGPNCYTEWQTKTPGGLVKDSLSKTLVDTGIDQYVSADEISEAVNVIVNALIAKLMSSVF